MAQTEVATVTVIGSDLATHADGTTSLILHTREAGTVAFVVDLLAIATIQQNLANAEQFLRRSPGNA
jgi:hypothetical protein